MSLLPACDHPICPFPLSRLSGRQRDCLRLAATGLTSAQIGDRLGLSSRTVDEHLLLACRALGVRTRIQAVVALVRMDRSAAGGAAGGAPHRSQMV